MDAESCAVAERNGAYHDYELAQAMNRNTMLAMGLLLLSILVPATLVIFVAPQIGGGSFQGPTRESAANEARGKKVWLSTPAFTLRGGQGEKMTLVAALKMDNSEDAVRVCKWMPLVRDRINVMAAEIQERNQGQDMIMSFERRRLKKVLTDVLRPTGPAVIKFLEAGTPPSQALTDAPSVICDGRRLDPTRSPLFAGN